MPTYLLAVEIGADTLLGAVGGALLAIPTLLTVFSAQRRERDTIRQELDAAKDEKLELQAGELADLKARVNLLESNFVDRIAQAVVVAIEHSKERT